jgi:2-polyprenyl-6-methoxyphenol hydroxylase-like FAD-dependent oxidoreductase
VPPASFLRIASMDELLPAAYRTVSVPRWHDGQLVLLGDAAHALSPQLGQGANLALMDAAALADAPSLAAYEASRRAAARFYAFGARALNIVWQNSFEPAAWPRDHLLGPVSRAPGMRRVMMRTLSGRMFM